MPWKGLEDGGLKCDTFKKGSLFSWGLFLYMMNTEGNVFKALAGAWLKVHHFVTCAKTSYGWTGLDKVGKRSGEFLFTHNEFVPNVWWIVRKRGCLFFLLSFVVFYWAVTGSTKTLEESLLLWYLCPDQKCLQDISSWMKSNWLKLNPGKI